MAWIDACLTDEIDEEDVIKWDHNGQTFALIRSADDQFYCIDGLCTHEHVHLADGLVMDFEIECPRHGGLFDFRTGNAVRAPACDPLCTYKTKLKDGRLWVEVP